MKDTTDTNNNATVDEDVSIGFRTSSEIKDRLQSLADQDERSLTSYLNILLKKHIADKEAGL